MKQSFGFGANLGGGNGVGGGGSAQLLRSIQRVYKAGGSGRGEGIYRSPPKSPTAGAAKYGDNNNKAGSNSTVLTLSNCTSPRNTSTGGGGGGSVFASTWPSCPSPNFSEDSDWECVIDIENDTESPPCLDDVMFGRTPSSDEVQRAFYSLQGFLELAEPGSSESSIYNRPKIYSDKAEAYQVSSPSGSSESSIYNRPKIYSDKAEAYQVSSPSGSLMGDPPFGAEPDWEEPSLQMCNSSWSPNRISQGDVYGALNLVQKDSYIQQIVESLSTDEAVWDAVKNNKVVRELRRAYYQADNISEDGSNGNSVGSIGATDIISRLVNKVKSKIMELMQNVTKILNELLHPPGEVEEGEGKNGAEKKYADHLVGKVKVSLFVTFMVFLTVVLQRMKHAGNPST